MKKINISYINSDKKIFKKVKLIGITAALCMLASCSVKEEKIIDRNNEDTVIENVMEETNPIENSELETYISLENTKEDEMVLVDNSENIVENEENTLVIDEQVTEESDEQLVNIDISSIELSNTGVSTYNTDFEISEELEHEINSYIKGFGASCSFVAINLKDGMTFGYNIDATYKTASTIKAPFSLYGFKEMDKGNGSLEELKLYEERFRRDGSGILKNQKSGTYYSLEDLFYYTINYSDNVAYYMVHDRFYNEGYNEFLKELGCNNLYLYGGQWGLIDARSMALVWREIYKYKDETENGKHLFELFTNAEYNYIKQGMTNYDSAHKSGWTPNQTHDSGIVFADDDYIVITLNNSGGNYSAKSHLLKISGCIEKVIDEYTLYKEVKKEKQKELAKKFFP